MVAKSYQNLEQIGDVYTADGRQYVNVRMKNGSIKKVRWYTDHEYNKMYPGEQIEEKLPGSQRLALGFKNGYIYIVKGDTYEHKDWLVDNGARYMRIWGWYFISTMDLPEAWPDGIQPVKLNWELVGKDEDLVCEDEVKLAVEPLLYDMSISQYQGNVGDRIEREVTITRVIPLENDWGTSKMYIMEDNSGNVYTWTTNARDWEAGSCKRIRGSVKAFQTWRNVRQTQLTRCQEVSL